MSAAATRQLALGDLPVVGLTNTKDPAVLALHGWGRSSKDFGFLLDTDLATASLDLPGFGGTPLPSNEWGTRDYADAIAAALDSRGWRDLVVVGHSRGGCTGALLAERRPDLVAGLVLTGAPLIRPPADGPKKKAPLAFRLAKLLNKIGVLSDAAMDKQRQKHGSADYRAAGPQLRPVLVRMVNENYDDELARLGRLGKPVALVWGGNDTAAPTAQVDRLRELLDPVLVTVGDGRGHDTVNEMRDELVAAVRAVAAAAERAKG